MEQRNAKFGFIADYYSEHYEELKAFVTKRVMHIEEAEDIVQNVFMRLLSSDKMITPITMPSLVYTVARNMVFDYWRHRQSVEEYEHYFAYAGSRGSVDGQSVYSAIEINELLERGMARLSDRQRDIYRLNIREGMQVREISERLHMNYKSVENRLGSARKEVRRYMQRMLA